MTVKAAVVVGNPKPHSRTRRIAEYLVDRLLAPGTYDLAVIDLADYTADIFDWNAHHVQRLNDDVAASDIVIFASPTYKGTYTGLLKAFLDRYQTNGLAGVIAIPLHTGGSSEHALGPTVSLAPLLAELGAVVPGRGFYFPLTRLEELDQVVAQQAEQYAGNLRKAAGVTQALTEVQAAGPTSKAEGAS